MKIDSFSIEGKHNSNEDSLSVLQIIDDKIIAVLADGMGGLTFGKEAADLIVSTITTFVCEHINKMTVSDLLIKALEFADKIEPEDQVYESYGIKVIVDPKSLPYINGTELDFVREGLNTGFKFKNPNEKESCGCGKSFHV